MALIEPGLYCGCFTFYGKQVGIKRVDVFGAQFHLNFEEMTITRLSNGDTRPMTVESHYPEMCEISCRPFKF